MRRTQEVAEFQGVLAAIGGTLEGVVDDDPGGDFGPEGRIENQSSYEEGSLEGPAGHEGRYCHGSIQITS